MERKARILLLDDDPVALDALVLALGESFEVAPFSSPDGAEAHLRTHDVDLALLDLHLEGQSGLEVLRRWRRGFPELEVAFCSGETSLHRALECLREGASEYIPKPFDPEALRLCLNRALEKSRLRRKGDKFASLVRPLPVLLVGNSAPVHELLAKIEKLRGQEGLNVLILGESGTGKELVARLLHQQEPDLHRPFVVVNTPAIPGSLMESELFGVEKGAFTDAKQSRAGKFEGADGGDLFLDEIGDLALETQAKILRTLQEKTVERLGSGRSRTVHFRVISATNRPLGEWVQSGKFREDLLYRLSDVVLRLPPLRERREDIPALVRHFIEKHRRGPAPEVAPEAMAELISHPWPGNIRQLESTVKRALVFNDGPTLRHFDCYDASLGYAPAPRGAARTLEEQERRLFTETLSRHRGNRDAAMGELRLSRATFYRRLKKFGLSEGSSLPPPL